MGWFNDQIQDRKIKDDEALENAFANIVSAVLGKRSIGITDDREIVQDAVEDILKYFHLSAGEIPDNITKKEEQLEFLLRPHGIMTRRVELTDGWYKDCAGPLLGVNAADGSAVALIPGRFGGYYYTDTVSGKRVKLNKKTAENIGLEAVCFYKPFPLRPMDLSDFFRFIIEAVPVSTAVAALAASVAVMLVGMLVPKISFIVMDKVVTSSSLQLLLSITVFSVCLTVSKVMFSAIESMLNSKISTLLELKTEAATMSRVMSLPASFFKNYSSGQLSCKMSYMNSLCSMLYNSVFSTSLTSLLSLVYITQIFKYAPALVVPALIIILVTLSFTVITTLSQMKYTRRQMDILGKENGMTYAMITGVQKIKLAGAEKRMFSRWLDLYAQETRLTYGKPVFLRLNGVVNAAISLAGTIALYFFAVESGVSMAEFNAFNASYGMISGAFLSLASVATTIAGIKPVIDEIKPIMDAQPEISEGRRIVTKVSGNIELSNVSFRYTENMPNVIDNLSLQIKSGQYVALVGATGCGKSTLVRLILGFEKPQKGSIYFDRQDIERLDLKSLRSKIGVVMQNGKLFYGDIFSNITISAPWLTLDDAWAAAETAGIADDIRAMPMGMHTIVSEGQGGFSGGQKQRLMIARAIAPKPKILIFDEATSALDNITQKKVSDALDGLKCTRIVIAHRLSTIRQCDRILVLDKGKIIEDGTYDELIEDNGYFAELVERQRID